MIVPNEILNSIFSYVSSPTALLIKDFTKEIKEEYESSFIILGNYDIDNDFRFSIWSLNITSMKHRYCICDMGIIRDGINY